MWDSRVIHGSAPNTSSSTLRIAQFIKLMPAAGFSEARSKRRGLGARPLLQEAGLWADGGPVGAAATAVGRVASGMWRAGLAEPPGGADPWATVAAEVEIATSSAECRAAHSARDPQRAAAAAARLLTAVAGCRAAVSDAAPTSNDELLGWLCLGWALAAAGRHGEAAVVLRRGLGIAEAATKRKWAERFAKLLRKRG